MKDEEGQGAATLSLRSQMKLTPEVLSYVASEGKLGRRQPYSKKNMDGTNYFQLIWGTLKKEDTNKFVW